MFEQLLKSELSKLGINLQEFSELLSRLLDYGVICRDESAIEAQLYDRYLACTELVEDYFSVMGIRLLHDTQFLTLRAYPPSAEVPGMIEDIYRPFNGGMRYRPNQQEVAVILVLRLEYEKAVREGLVDDKGCVLLAFEALAMAMKNLLKRNLPENANERLSIFKRLRQLRLIHFASEEMLDSSEYWLSIQPAIVNYVSSEALDALYPKKSSTDASSQDLDEENNNNRSLNDVL